MRQRTFYAAMCLPLLLGFIGAGMVIQDLKHPRVIHEQCQLVGRGTAIHAFTENAKPLFRVSKDSQNDIGMQCPHLGNVFVNEPVSLALEPAAPVQITIKQFRMMPDRYSLSFPVINSDLNQER